MTIDDKTKIPLFIVLGSLVILVPVCFWFAELRSDATDSMTANVEQEDQIKDLNKKLEVVYEMRTDLKLIKTVLKIKEEVSYKGNNHEKIN